MWAFSGAEHYARPGKYDRIIDGYTRENRPEYTSGIDINRFIWTYKFKSWRNTDISIVCPSKWLTVLARSSKILGNKKIYHILNPVDLDIYKPMERDVICKSYELNPEKRFIMFSSMNAFDDQRKGYKYLKEAIQELSNRNIGYKPEIIIVGTRFKKVETKYGLKFHYMGSVKTELEMSRMYNMADVFVLPSEMDNLPNTIKEASSCGVPCVGFDVGGLPDMIDHKETGYLAKPYEKSDLTNGIIWVLQNTSKVLSGKVRRQAEIRHDPASRVKDYLHIYEDLLRKQGCKEI
jgi:glycosyltransferase involved in cell wall biosynthesis